MFTKAKSFMNRMVSRIKGEEVEVLDIEIITDMGVEAAVKAEKRRADWSYVINYVLNILVSFGAGYLFGALLIAFPEIMFFVCAFVTLMYISRVVSSFFIGRVKKSHATYNRRMDFFKIVFGEDAVAGTIWTKIKETKVKTSPEVVSDNDDLVTA